MPSRHRDVMRREVVLLIVGACLLSVVMNWPLVLHLGQNIPHDLGDPLAETWQVAWDGHALAHQPLQFFDSNQFWPFHDTLAFSDALVGYAPAGLLGSGPHAAVVRYDLLFLFAYALAFVGAYLLGRELGLGPAGATVCGAAFAFAPFRLEQDGHMQVISSGGIPLALALAVRGYRLRRTGWVVAGFVVGAWQLSIGFTLGLPFAYLIVALALIVAVVWWRRGLPRVDRRLAVATVCGALLFAGAGFALSRPYVKVADEHPGVRRTPGVVETYSGPPSVFLVAPSENLVWGGATAGLRNSLSNSPEKTLFPGLAIVALAAAGMLGAAYPRWLRRALLASVVIISVLALGFRAGGGLLWPYRIVYDVLPGWQAIRAPGRLVTFSSLGLGLLAGAGAEWLALAARARRRGAIAVAGALALLVVFEGRGLPFNAVGYLAQPKVPPTPPSAAAAPAPQLHLPALRATDNRRYLLWSTDGFPKLVNGRSSLNPAFTARVIKESRGFPSRRTVMRLRRIGVRSVVLHTNRTPGTPWRGAAEKPVAGLPVTRRSRGKVVVYRIHPIDSRQAGAE